MVVNIYINKLKFLLLKCYKNYNISSLLSVCYVNTKLVSLSIFYFQFIFTSLCLQMYKYYAELLF